MVINREPALIHPAATPPDGIRNGEWSSRKPEPGCSNSERLRRIHNVCAKTNISEYKYDNVRWGRNNTIVLLYADDARKLLYCRIGKVGSTTFMHKLMSTRLLTSRKATSKSGAPLQKTNIKQSWNVSVSDVNTKYKNYTKLILVRHPLQRVVSAYYEIMIKRKKYRQNKTSKPMSLDEFLRNVPGSLMDHDPHWTRYHNRCKLCSVNYHYVIHTETMESDLSKMAGVFRANRKRFREKLGHRNVGRGNFSEVFRHDQRLREFQLNYPVHMRRLLDFYKDDMELFDYGWDWHNMRSLCRGSTKSIKCC